MKYSLVIPAHNEEKRIKPTLNELVRYIRNNSLESKVEVIIAVNNSSDNTIVIANEYSESNSFIRFVNYDFYTGKGGAVARGILEAKGDYVGFVDADGASSPKEVFKMFKELEYRDVDGVIASRYIDKTLNADRPVDRWFTSRVFNKIAKYGFGLNYKDTQCGLKVFRSDVAKELAKRIAIVGWTFDINLLLIAKYLKYNISEVASVWVEKENSTMKFTDAVKSVIFELSYLKYLEANQFSNSIKLTSRASILSVKL